jgi:putative addiction module component (TIGR02574 family)
MTPRVSELLERALLLPLEEQEILANTLISNLGCEASQDVQPAWDDEIKRRLDEIRSGKAKMSPWEEVRRRAADRLRNTAR